MYVRILIYWLNEYAHVRCACGAKADKDKMMICPAVALGHISEAYS